VQGRNVTQAIWQDSHVWVLSRRKNLGRITHPRVRRALATPEHAPTLGPARAAPHQARPHARARARARARAYKADQGLDRTPPLALNLDGAQDHRRSLCARCASGRPRPDHRRPATLAIPRPVQPSL
jgi:hypothetical protein